jgi:hypothetical protein
VASVVSASVLAPPSASAAEDVFDALGPESLGTSVDRVLAGSGFSCGQHRSDPEVKRCTSTSSTPWILAGTSASSVEALIKDAHLLQVTVHFSESRFAQVLLALSTRFGEGVDWTVTIRSGMAGQLPDQIRIWETDRFALVAQQYDRKIDRSSVIYGSAAAMAPLLRQIHSTPRGALRDL